jgi:hypothetical protein
VRRRLRWCAVACGIVSTLAGQAARAPRLYVTDAGAALVAQGLALAAPHGPEAAEFREVPAPALRNAPNSGYAQATLAPWVESNGWRFQRGLDKASYARLPAGAAPLAAAEAFAFGVDAVLNPDPADVKELGNVLGFLKRQEQPPWPALANIGLVDDGSAEMGEVLNMLTRRNLLYRVVAQPDRRLNLTVQVGTADFPKSALTNPSDFAARVRDKLGDDKRLVRLYGTNSTIARLTGDGRRVRLFLLSYSRNRIQQDIHVRLLGRFRPAASAVYSGGAPEPKLTDVEYPSGTTEFVLPMFNTIAIFDLDVVK